MQIKLIAKFNFYWRLCTTALCFSVFGVGGILLACTVFPIQRIVYRDAEHRRQVARKTVHKSFRFFIGMMSKTGTASFDVDNLQELRQLRGNIIIANHPSLIDVVVLISIIPNADCIVKAHLFRNPFMRGVIRSTGYISNADPEGLLEDCKRSLSMGNNLIIFPEGTRTTPGQPIKFQRGTANIVLRCKPQIMPLLINVAPTTLTKQCKWYHIPPRKFSFSMQKTSGVPSIQVCDREPLGVLSRRLTRELEVFYQDELKVYE